MMTQKAMTLFEALTHRVANLQATANAIEVFTCHWLSIHLKRECERIMFIASSLSFNRSLCRCDIRASSRAFAWCYHVNIHPPLHKSSGRIPLHLSSLHHLESQRESETPLVKAAIDSLPKGPWLPFLDSGDITIFFFFFPEASALNVEGTVESLCSDPGLTSSKTLDRRLLRRICFTGVSRSLIDFRSPAQIPRLHLSVVVVRGPGQVAI